MSNNQKKYLTIAAVALAVIVADKMFSVSNKVVAKLQPTKLRAVA